MNKFFLFTSLFILFFLVISPNNFLNSDVLASTAKVVMLKGHVTKLAPGAHVAVNVKLHDILNEDTSILTGSESFIQIRYQDASSINLGPKSKVVINKINKGSNPQIVSLLTGRLRAEVSKRKDGVQYKNKFYVKTRNAAMGVRGTDFEAIYNPKSNATSLITFDGEVAMVKTQEKGLIPAEFKKGEAKKEVKLEEVENTLDKELKNKNLVIVKQGRFSGVVESLDNATIPVKISPDQFNALSDSNLSKDKKDKKTKDIPLSKASDEEDPSPDGYYDEASGTLAPKAGGYIDLDSGFYIPPPKGSKLDTKSNVYIPPKEMGVISDKGDYIPPEGIKIDSEKGIILAENSKNSEEAKKAKELLDGSFIESPGIKQNDEILEKIKLSKESGTAYPKNLTFNFGFVKNSIKSSSKSSSASQKNVSDMGYFTDIRFGLSPLSKTEFFTGIGVKYFDFSQTRQKNVYQTKKSYWSFLVGARYELIDRIHPVIILKREENPVIDSTTELRIKYLTQNILLAGLDFYLVKNDNLTSKLNLAYKLVSSANKGDVNGKSGNGYALKLDSDFILGPNDRLGAFIFLDHDEFETNNNKISREERGLGVHFIIAY